MRSILGPLPVNHRCVSYALYEFRFGALAEIIDERFTVLAIVGGDSKLDQFVVIEGNIELGKHRAANTGGADADHRA